MERVLSCIVLVLGCALIVCAQTRVRVTAESAVLRGTPEAAGTEIAKMKRSESAELIITRGDWHLIQTSRYVGWIDTRSINKEYGESDGSGSGVGTGQGSGRPQASGAGGGMGTGPDGITTPLKILSKPAPPRTEQARSNKTTGTVVLRVMFQADGTIGLITPVKGLPNGLTDQAINAAQRIQFEPAKRDGIPITVTKVLEYTFSVY